MLRKAELNYIPDKKKDIRHPPFMGRKMVTPSAASLNMISGTGNEGRSKYLRVQRDADVDRGQIAYNTSVFSVEFLSLSGDIGTCAEGHRLPITRDSF